MARRKKPWKPPLDHPWNVRTREGVERAARSRRKNPRNRDGDSWLARAAFRDFLLGEED